jgi:hypothetical protein
MGNQEMPIVPLAFFPTAYRKDDDAPKAVVPGHRTFIAVISRRSALLDAVQIATYTGAEVQPWTSQLTPTKRIVAGRNVASRVVMSN